ncbi:MAG: radical SAM protein, partial [archaeon]|nr:radical SAM protein [archaeon]
IKNIDSMKYNIDSNLKNHKNIDSKIKDIDSKTSSKKAKVSIKFSVNPVIPKAHTPLQWETYDIKSIKSKIKYLKKELKNINIKFDSAKLGLIQYILSCGDKEVGYLIEESLNRKISMKEWKEYVPDYEIGDSLPWDVIDVSVTKEFLLEEYKKIENKDQTPWCEENNCYNCGAC